MSDLRFSAKKAEHTDIPRPKRGEGQWALGYTEPLNKNEQSKKDDDPLHVRDRILNIYSKRGFASIDPADLRGRFRWMGLYTQRAPGFHGEPSSLGTPRMAMSASMASRSVHVGLRRNETSPVYGRSQRGIGAASPRVRGAITGLRQRGRAARQDC